MDAERDDEDSEEIYTRPPTTDDLLKVCRLLNEARVRYVIIGGMAINHLGFIRGTQDIDSLVDDSGGNDEKYHEGKRPHGQGVPDGPAGQGCVMHCTHSARHPAPPPQMTRHLQDLS